MLHQQSHLGGNDASLAAGLVLEKGNLAAWMADAFRSCPYMLPDEQTCHMYELV